MTERPQGEIDAMTKDDARQLLRAVRDRIAELDRQARIRSLDAHVQVKTRRR